VSCAINTKGLWPLRAKGLGTLFLLYPQISDPKQIFLTVIRNTLLQGRWSQLRWSPRYRPCVIHQHQTKLFRLKNRPCSAVLPAL